MSDELQITEIDDVEVVKVPARFDPEWSNYVMSLLTDDEMEGGYPKVDGLRRLAQQLVGEIVESSTHVAHVHHHDGNVFIVIVHSITFVDDDGVEHMFDGAADGGHHNIRGDYVMYPTAVTETRAEGRALRRALNLKTIVAEELAEVKIPSVVEVPKNLGMMTDIQKNSLQKLCGTGVRGMDVNVAKLAKKLLDKEVVDLTKEDAALLLKNVTEMQRDDSLLTDDIKGYEKW